MLRRVLALTVVTLLALVGVVAAQQPIVLPGGAEVRVYTPSLTPTAITTGQVSRQVTVNQNFTVTGLSTSDTVWVSGPSPTSACPMTGWRVASANTLTLQFTLVTSASCTPAAGTYRITTIRSNP